MDKVRLEALHFNWYNPDVSMIKFRTSVWRKSGFICQLTLRELAWNIKMLICKYGQWHAQDKHGFDFVSHDEKIVDRYTLWS